MLPAVHLLSLPALYFLHVVAGSGHKAHNKQVIGYRPAPNVSGKKGSNAKEGVNGAIYIFFFTHLFIYSFI